MPFIQINMLEGRTVEQKRELAKVITKGVSTTLGVPEDVVTIIIKDVPKTNFAKSGKLACD